MGRTKEEKETCIAHIKKSVEIATAAENKASKELNALTQGLDSSLRYLKLGDFSAFQRLAKEGWEDHYYGVRFRAARNTARRRKEKLAKRLAILLKEKVKSKKDKKDVVKSDTSPFEGAAIPLPPDLDRQIELHECGEDDYTIPSMLASLIDNNEHAGSITDYLYDMSAKPVPPNTTRREYMKKTHINLARYLYGGPLPYLLADYVPSGDENFEEDFEGDP